MIALYVDKEPNPRSVGPIMKGIMETDIPISVGDNEEYDEYLVFHNKPPKVKADKPVSWWMCDLRYPTELPEPTREYKNIFLCNKQLIPLYEDYYQTDVYYMPQPGLPESWQYKESTYEVKQDVIFIGNFNSQYHSNRGNIIDKISTKHPVLVISNEGQTRDQAGLYRKTPFSLAISQQVEGYTSNRLYNILASGGLCLTLWFPGIEDLFEHGKHLLWFKTADEAIELIKEYLTKEEKCDIIRTQGKKLYEEKHTASCRVENMLAIMRGDEHDFRGWI